MTTARKHSVLPTVVAILLAAAASLLAGDANRYALILSDAPMAGRITSFKDLASAANLAHRGRIEAAQGTLRRELERRQISVVSTCKIVLNAVFVDAPAEREGELNGLPGVIRAVRLPRMRLALDQAVQLVNAPGAWSALGGAGNAGAGIKIGILDTGIDQNHAAFQDNALTVPAGFPKCQGSDCNFTNHKVIVARSYVSILAGGSGINSAATSRPDDLSPRDRTGHGTALGMVSGGETNTGPSDTITGMAPKAWLGNYKVFGSPGINDFTGAEVFAPALDDAITDGMDIVVMSFGQPAFIGATAQGADCGIQAGQACDAGVQAVQNAVSAGLTVVIAAGNNGTAGNLSATGTPTLTVVSSPGIAPSAITAGATTNSHAFYVSVQVKAAGAPANLQRLNAAFGDGPQPAAPVTAPLKDVAQLGNDGLACQALPPQSLTGSFALILRGTCNFSVKVLNAQTAGAVGVILYNTSGQQTPAVAGGLSVTSIPALMVGNGDGLSLKAFIDANPNTPAAIDPTLFAVNVTPFDAVADFSSRGPAIDSGAIKPEIAAVGTNMYMAAERYDPNGPLYSGNGYTVASGTSFAAPLTAGAAALVKQKNSKFTPAQIKSALVNTATQDVTDETGNPARVTAVGGGKLNAGNAVNATVTSDPATISFGYLNPVIPLPLRQQLTITNGGTGSVNLSVTVAPRDTDNNAKVTVDSSSLTIGAGQSQTLTVLLLGTPPVAGSYEGAVLIQGGGAALRIPYSYVMGTGVPYNIIPLTGGGAIGIAGNNVPGTYVVFKLIDQYGAPVSGYPVTWSATLGGGRIVLRNADTQTDSDGIAAAQAVLGPSPGANEFVGRAGRLSAVFDDTGELQATLAATGVVNAASFQAGQGIAPGSYISLFGTALSDVTQQASTSPLPISLGSISVSFDAGYSQQCFQPPTNSCFVDVVSLPGSLYYVSPGQVNVQVPWEIQGQPSVQIKVTNNYNPGTLVTLPVVTYSPGVFAYNEASTAQSLAAALDQNSRLIGTANPARRGATISIYANGLGPVSNQPADGAPAPSQPLAQTTTTPTVTIGAQSATVSFSGLAPGYSGLYQLNVIVPPSASTGLQPVTLSIGGVAAQSVNMPVQ